MDCADLWEEFHSRVEPMGSRTVCRRRPGGLLILASALLAVEELRTLSPTALHLYRVQQAASVSGRHAERGQGGAIVPLIQGADHIGIHHAFFIPVICYLYILFYALNGSKPNSERYATS